MWKEYLNTAINNLLTFLNPSWQEVILLLGVVIIIKFRKNIAGLIDRINKIGIEGIHCDPSQPSPPLTLEETKSTNETILQNITSIETIISNEKIIKDNLENKQLASEDSKIKSLTRDLAEVYFVLRCERIYNSIFGSQIQLIKILSENRLNGVDQNHIDDYFTIVRNKDAGFYSNWNCMQYINFLLQSGVIIKQDNMYKITPFGIDFLTWLQRSGYPEKKNW